MRGFVAEFGEARVNATGPGVLPRDRGPRDEGGGQVAHGQQHRLPVQDEAPTPYAHGVARREVQHVGDPFRGGLLGHGDPIDDEVAVLDVRRPDRPPGAPSLTRHPTGDGVLWMLGESPDEPGSSGAEFDELITAQPPVRSPCAVKSAQVCPHLRRRCTVLRAHSFDLVGVRGALYRPGRPVPVPWDAAGVGFGDPRIRWIRAGQSLARLGGTTVVDLDALRGGPSAHAARPLADGTLATPSPP